MSGASGGPPLLEVTELEVSFATRSGVVRAVAGVTFALERGEAVGLVGESGAGKTQVFLAVMGLLAANGRARGSVRFAGEPILGLEARALNRFRGARLAMVFQDPMSSLNPYLTIRRQMTEVLVVHAGRGEEEAARESIAMLERVQIPHPRRCMEMYPHELSGGMRQRVMIATALLGRPALLIADEPTTALDVTVQAAILELLGELRRETGMALVLVTHDLGVVAGLCERVMVMYAGRIVEAAPCRDLFRSPRHPYTAGLLRSMPRLDAAPGRIRAIPGQPPDLRALPSGCAFRERCEHRLEVCARERPALLPFAAGRSKACHLDREPR
jgi:oligopeptide transport system ATP-binding protein